MKSSIPTLKRSLTVKHEDMNGGESPLHNFVKAKKKINQTFDEIGKYLEESSQFLCSCELSDDHKEDVKDFSAEVFETSFKLCNSGYRRKARSNSIAMQNYQSF